MYTEHGMVILVYLLVISQRSRCVFFLFRFRAKIVTWHVFKYRNQKVASDVSSLVNTCLLGWSLAFKEPGFIRDYKKGILSLQNSPLDIICSLTYVLLCVCCRWILTFLLAVWWSIPERIISTAHEYLNMIGIYQVSCHRIIKFSYHEYFQRQKCLKILYMCKFAVWNSCWWPFRLLVSHLYLVWKWLGLTSCYELVT